MCIFCLINPDLILLESENSVLIANYYPIGGLSLLAVPKAHVSSITELSSEALKDLMDLIALAANIIKEKTNPEGLNIFLNEGVIAGQSLSHLHFHIVARSKNDGIKNFERSGPRKIITKEDLVIIKRLF